MAAPVIPMPRSEINPIGVDANIDRAERIGVIGSPSSTSELCLDVTLNAVNRKLIGELALFRFQQNTNPNYALGQITEVTLRNPWHEDPTIRSIIRQRGRVDAVSERQDTHQAKITISAVFQRDGTSYAPSILGTVPPTGTAIHIVDDPILEGLLTPYRDQLFYLGKVFGSTPKLPLWFKHFDIGPSGAGEAYHLGIFGKTGSGKSVLAKMILLGYARHQNMGLFILDPMGEFSSGIRQQQGIATSMGNIFSGPTLARLGRTVELIDIDHLRISRWEIFERLLQEFKFVWQLGVRYAQYEEELASYIVEDLRNAGTTLNDLQDIASFNAALQSIVNNVGNVYQTGNRAARIAASAQAGIAAGATAASRLWQIWGTVTHFFANQPGARDAGQLVQNALASDQRNRPIMVIDLSHTPAGISRSVWEDRIKPLLIDSFLDEIIRRAEIAYQDGQSLNTLVVLDEAHRLAPAHRVENEQLQRVKTRLVDAVRTTRKFGLGWMFLSLTLASLDLEIRQQLRASFYGFGLGSGNELDALKQLAGGDKNAISLYQQFKDPQSAFSEATRDYSFMTTGPVSPLSFSGTPLFFSAFTSVPEFLEANRIA